MSQYYATQPFPNRNITSEVAPTATYQAGMGGWLDSAWDFAKDVGTGVKNMYGQTERQKGAMEAYKAKMAAQKGPPGWLLPVAIGAGGLVLVLLLKKRK